LLDTDLPRGEGFSLLVPQPCPRYTFL
jgi:hypothetical protein